MGVDRRQIRIGIAAATGLALLSACEVGPDYKRPDVATPEAFKEASSKEAPAETADGWKVAEPKDAQNRGPWWSIYNDPTLDGLEQQVEINNENLKSFEASFRQARAIVGEARSGYFPMIGTDASLQRTGHGPGGTGGSNFAASNRPSPSRVQTQYDLSASASWDLDLWGRIRRTVEGDVAGAQASAGDLASATLSAQGTLATDYLTLRVDDELKRLLDATVGAFTKSLEIAQNRYSVGVAAKSDVASAQAQLETVRAQAIAVGVQRAQLEHAIAVLIGKPPAEFSIAPVEYALNVPDMPADLPSALLERRPDVAAAERRVAAANAQIGVAVAAYYPDLSLSGSYGFANTVLSSLVTASSVVWAVGPKVAETIFDGGLRDAQVEAAKAGYDQSVATYRQTVLTAFQQVEDQLAAAGILEQQAAVQQAAIKASEEAERLVLNEYKAGTVDYTSVITAQTTALNNKQGLLTITQSRLTASATLIQALGGGWTAAQLPTSEQIHDRMPAAETSKTAP